jgi:hypothetical protein
MPRTLRLNDAAQSALERIATSEQISENEAIQRAVLEYDKKRASIRDALIQQIVTEDKALLERLA